jgi:CrcB protein
VHLLSDLPDVFQQASIRVPIAIGLGAIAGALSRYYITLWVAQRFGTQFPYGTFFINLTGCFLMGFFIVLSMERIRTISLETRLMVATGFLGSYTTFSTYGMDTLTLLSSGHFNRVGLYWLGSAMLGVMCTQLGVWLARFGK